MVLYDIFFKRFGIRLPQHLMTPSINLIEKFEFPKNSLFHNLTFDGVASGPANDEFLFRNISKQILMEHVLELDDSKGIPRKIPQQVLPYIREYHVKHRRFRFLKDASKINRDENSLLIINYDFIPKLYRYMRSQYTEYHKWWNLEKTLWQTVEDTAKINSRQQFIFVNLPKILPSVNTLNLYSDKFNSSLIKIFNSPESLFVLEIWKWLGADTRDTSVLSTLSNESLNKVNIVYQESGHWMMFNLGIINRWRHVPNQPDDTTKIHIDSVQLQKRFLRTLISLMNTRSTPVDPEDEVTDENGNSIEKDDARILDEESRFEKAERILSSMDSDLKELEVIEKQISDGLIEQQSIASTVNISGVINISDFHTEETPDSAIISICDKLAEDGLLTASNYRNLLNNAKSYQTIKAPTGEGTLENFIEIDPKYIEITESTNIVDISTVLDKSMLKSSLLKFDEKYIEKVLSKDVAGMVVNVQKAGVILNNYTVEKESDILGDYEIHTLKVKPVEGTGSTLRFKLPVVSSEGVITYNGNKYRLRKQRGDLPIRKLSPDTVALTSYYGKTFVTRSSKKVNNYSDWLCSEILIKGLDSNDKDIENLATSKVFNNEIKTPRIYSTLAMEYKGFTANGYEFNFDHSKRLEFYGQDAIDNYEKDSSLIIAKNNQNSYLTIDDNDTIYENSDNKTTLKGSIESILNIDNSDAPIEFSEVKIYGKNITVGFILAYRLGLTNLLSLLKIEPRQVTAGQRLNLENNEFAITFSDVSIIFNRDDKLSSIIVAGLLEYKKALRKYSLAAMDKQQVYLNILESVGCSVRYLKEIDLINNLFVDPITKELLIEMKEPTSFHGLLVRSSEMLLLDNHPDELDMGYMRIKGYERLAGAVYLELVQSIRAHNSQPGKAGKPLSLHPFAVWLKITQDPSLSLVSDINPIENLKEVEAVTYSGIGGRNSRSMVKRTREYHQSDVGVISEATKDSSDVGVNIYTSADPQFKSVRGTTKPYVNNKTGITAVLSTAALISPGSDHDDAKRVNFVSIQHGHGIACKGYKQPNVRTGYEQVIAHRTSDLFAYTARQNGTVISRNETGIHVQYEDGSSKGYEVGKRFGNASGLVLPHNIISDLKTGDSFKRGDVISYNEGFFEKDLLNPKQVVWKVGTLAKTVLYESNQTLEDASSISKKLALELTTQTTKVKMVVVSFDQTVKSMVEEDDPVEPESILCVIEDVITSGSDLFDEHSLNTLKLLSNQAPVSKVRGIVDKIEVFYHGQKEDMSDTLRQISNIYDKNLSARNKSIGKGAITGSVGIDMRVDGEPLALDTMVIKFYITSDVPAGIGDKGVFCNQMKTVFSEVMDTEMRTENGEIIDAVFGAKSIADRIVLSPEMIGTTNTLLSVISKKAAQLYYNS